MIRRRRTTSYAMSCLEATHAMRAMTAALAGHHHPYAESITEMQIARARRLYIDDEIDVPELERQIAEALRPLTPSDRPGTLPHGQEERHARPLD